MSEASETSFEELVVIQERQDGDAIPHLAVREEADRLSALEALAVKSGLTVAKQVCLQVNIKFIKNSRTLTFFNILVNCCEAAHCFE